MQHLQEVPQAVTWDERCSAIGCSRIPDDKDPRPLVEKGRAAPRQLAHVRRAIQDALDNLSKLPLSPDAWELPSLDHVLLKGVT